MADTKQSVRWRLSYSCPLRNEEDWSTELLEKAQIYQRIQNSKKVGFKVLNGVCVAGTSDIDLLADEDKKRYFYPYSGFDVQKAFASLEGLDDVLKLCGACPANAAKVGPAGCSGYLYFSPYKEELEARLQQIISELNLKSALDEAFPPAELVWFRFWMESPLSRPALKLLHLILGTFAKGYESNELPELEVFVRAIEQAMLSNLELHILLLPPGHVDFGWHHIFAHCPRCKAHSHVNQWKKVRHAWLSCEMCGQEFDPALTASRFLDSDKSYRLQDELGKEGFGAFAIEYLKDQGAPEAEASAYVAKSLAPRVLTPEQLEKKRLRDEIYARKLAFIQTHLCAGFTRLEEGMSLENAVTRFFQLTESEVRTLLERCRKFGAEVSTITHFSEIDDDLNELTNCIIEFGSPEAAFEALLNEGCHELFSVGAGMSNEALEVALQIIETEKPKVLNPA